MKRIARLAQRIPLGPRTILHAMFRPVVVVMAWLWWKQIEREQQERQTA